MSLFADVPYVSCNGSLFIRGQSCSDDEYDIYLNGERVPYPLLAHSCEGLVVSADCDDEGRFISLEEEQSAHFDFWHLGLQRCVTIRSPDAFTVHRGEVRVEVRKA